MISDLTRMAALVSSSLTKVDKNMINTGTGGGANKINVRNFLETSPASPQVVQTIPAPPVEQIPMPSPSPAPPPPIPVISQEVLSPPTTPGNVFSSLDISPITAELSRIATELGKINKKMTSIQKHLNSKTIKTDDIPKSTDPAQQD